MSLEDIIEYLENCKNLSILKFLADYVIQQMQKVAGIPTTNPMEGNPLIRLKKLDLQNLKDKTIEIKFFADRFKTNELVFVNIDYRNEEGFSDSKLPGMTIEELTAYEFMASLLLDQVRYHLHVAHQTKSEVKNEIDKITGS